MKNDLSVSGPGQQYRRWPATLYAQAERTGAPLLSQRPGSEVNMDLWTYPMIIPRAVSCEAGVNRAGGGERGGGGHFYKGGREEEKGRGEKKSRASDEGEMRSKKACIYKALRGPDHEISMQVICSGIHSHHSCPGLSCPPLTPPSPPPQPPAAYSRSLIQPPSSSRCL